MRKILNVKAKAFMPVHVGGGEDHKLDPLDYVVKGDWFYRINISNILIGYFLNVFFRNF